MLFFWHNILENHIWTVEFEIWVKANIYPGQRPLHDHLILLCRVPDQNNGNEGSGLDNGLSGRVCQKPAFSSLSQLIPLFSETCDHPSLSFIHQTKPDSSYYHHLKYEPDRSTYARDKWGVKIAMDCRTPCITNEWLTNGVFQYSQFRIYGLRI